ncbi:hypothetical protein [Microbispora sp. NPDC049125]|uniref:hypothetical protein n=1 Tax=Microbispora sp. NPDC049125 TaxID=3154929 RepID=UPI003466D257
MTDDRYTLTWGQPGHAPNYALTERQAQKLIDGWRGKGTLTGTLADGNIKFVDSFGKTAHIRHFSPRKDTRPLFASELRRGHQVVDDTARGDGIVFHTETHTAEPVDKIYVWFYGNSHAATYWADTNVEVTRASSPECDEPKEA